MLNSLLIGAVAGARSMTPLAAVSRAARRGQFPLDNGAPDLLAHPVVGAGTLLMAAGEFAGDKMKSAPDRIVALGLAARLFTGAVAGAALAPRHHRYAAGALGAAAAVAASYLTFNLRIRALRRYGQTATGLAEDALVLGATAWIMSRARVAVA